MQAEKSSIQNCMWFIYGLGHELFRKMYMYIVYMIIVYMYIVYMYTWARVILKACFS